MKYSVFIAASIDGYIADIDGNIDWLNIVPNPTQDDMGWSDYLNSIDAIIMGRNTFEKVLSFDVPWPYPVPVFVASSTLKTAPEGYEDKIKIVKGNPGEITESLKNEGYKSVYVDGGNVINQFLKADLIDEITVTTIPILLGGGIPLFSELEQELVFNHIETKVFVEHVVQTKYTRNK